ncbi:hypothetical protein [Nostoc sp. CHAB 5715]|uniref:hypothetical protein n=1 Tax=Nostoc sp. CHAB 5715 TaxID=2780400 RepID=UPI001E643C5C|nr:hypothetical protein [Nostoc sp. CHAB 5715]MCC5623553.1 hypothetical protein [Nostoc sp. CHAB 5715]
MQFWTTRFADVEYVFSREFTSNVKFVLKRSHLIGSRGDRFSQRGWQMPSALVIHRKVIALFVQARSLS